MYNQENSFFIYAVQLIQIIQNQITTFNLMNKKKRPLSKEVSLCITLSRGGILIYPCPFVRSSIRIQIHGLSGNLLQQFWSYSFNILFDVYTHNGGVHVHRILIFIKYSQNDRQLDCFHTSCIKGTWFVRLTPPTVLELQL